MALREILIVPLEPLLPAQSLHEPALRLPKSYLSFVDTYGAGRLNDFLSIFAPGVPNLSFELSHRTQEQGLALVEFLRHADELPKRLAPLTSFGTLPFDGSKGLIYWGISDNGDQLCFGATSDDADRWPIVVLESHLGSMEVFSHSFQDFLEAMLGDQLQTEILPRDFSGEQAIYVSP